MLIIANAVGKKQYTTIKPTIRRYSMESTELKNIIEYAAEHIAYYRDSYRADGAAGVGDLERFPVLDKDALQSDHDMFVSDEYQYFPKLESILVRDAVGSDGRLFKLYCDNKTAEQRENAMKRLRKELYGIDENDRKCSFYRIQYIGNKVRNFDECRDIYTKNEISFFVHGMTGERILEICSSIRSFEPRWMSVRPSIALLIAGVMKREGLPAFKGLEFIEFEDEYISAETKREIEEAFGAKGIRSYGCEETSCAAYEYPDGKLHVLSDYVSVETAKGKSLVYGEEGDILITTLREHSMPLIRFSTGDRGIITKNGNGEDIIEITQSRKNDYVSLGDSGRLSSESIALMIELTNTSMSRSIKQFRIIQNDIDDFTVKMTIMPAFRGWKKAVEESFLSNIREPLLKRARWNFVWEDEIDYSGDNSEKSFYINCLGA